MCLTQKTPAEEQVRAVNVHCFGDFVVFVATTASSAVLKSR
jgi:hypothetical protein